MGIFEKWKQGETVRVRSKYSGKIFSIRPERWEGISIGYTILVDGQLVPEHHRKMVDAADFRRWCADLVEVEEEENHDLTAS
jgi:hypothetical protein